MGICDVILLTSLVVAILALCFFSVYCRVMPRLEEREKMKKSRMQKQNADETKIQDLESKKVLEKESGIQKIKNFVWWLLNNYFYGLMRYSMQIVGSFPSFKVRNLLYRYVFNMDITNKTVIYGGCEIRSPWNFHAGNCVISNRCVIDARNGVYLADNVVFGAGVHIWTEEHDVNDPFFAVNEKNRAPVVIGEHAWICSDTTVLPGVHVGEGAVLASRACATKDLEAFCVYGGIPAKIIGKRNEDLQYVLSGKPTYYFY